MEANAIKTKHCFVVLNKKLNRSEIQPKHPIAHFDTYVAPPSKETIIRVELEDGTYDIFDVVNQYTEYNHDDECTTICFGIGLKKRSRWAGTGKVILSVLNALKK